MARKGKLPIDIPNGTEVKISEQRISVKGPKGLIEQTLPNDVDVKVEEGKIFVSMTENSEHPNFHGLFRTLIDNMVTGSTKGFQRVLEMIGVGYRAQVQGTNLNLTVGFSHPTLIPIPSWAQVTVEKNTRIIINGIDKQKVGQFAAKVRSIRPPEPYQGKGIRFEGEYVRKKAGKTAKK